jgi:neutral ceramidase
LRPAPEVAASDPDVAARCRGVRTQPNIAYAVGDVAVAEVEGDDPRGPARAVYLLVQMEQDTGWKSVATDGDWATTVTWREDNESGWVTTLTWRVPVGTSGAHRLVFVDRVGTKHATHPFTV